MLASGVRVGELTRVRAEDLVEIGDVRYPRDPPHSTSGLKIAQSTHVSEN